MPEVCPEIEKPDAKGLFHSVDSILDLAPDSFGRLVSEVKACTLCAPYLPLLPKPIIQLHPNARILIVGQAPGKKAYDSGIPFNDVSGQRLRLWMGINEKQFYNPKKIVILPMGFCYPGTGKSGDLPPRPV